MYNAKLSESKIKNKRYTVTLYDDKMKKLRTVHFGSSKYDNYTIHKDEKRLQ